MEGSKEPMGRLIKITDGPISIDEGLRQVASHSNGGIVTFTGSTRSSTKDKKVKYLFYDAYVPMARSEMAKIADFIAETFEVRDIAMVHRIGKVPIGETSVLVATAAPHRAEAFKACRYAIDTLKNTVPIWKKEFFEDGEVWVGNTPSEKPKHA